MKVNRQELVNILAAVRPGLSKRDIEEQASHFIFTGTAIVTYNDDICIAFPYKTDFEGSVKALDFYKVLMGMDEMDVDLTMKSGNLHIQGKKTRSGLATLAEGTILDMIKLVSPEEQRTWKPLPKDIKTGLFLCMFSVSRITNGPRNCVHIGGNLLQSTDNYRISRYELEFPMEDTFLLPVGTIQEFIKFDVDKYCLTDSWVYFQTIEKVVFACRYVKGDFPDTSKFFAMEGTPIILPDGLKKIVDDVAIMAVAEIDYLRRMEVVVGKQQIICRSEKDRGWLEKEIDFKNEGEEFIFYINPQFFSQVLDRSTTIILHGERALFLSDKYKHMMALPSNPNKQ